MTLIRRPENFIETEKVVQRKLAFSQEELARVSFARTNRWGRDRKVLLKQAQRQFAQFCALKWEQGELPDG